MASTYRYPSAPHCTISMLKVFKEKIRRVYLQQKKEEISEDISISCALISRITS